MNKTNLFFILASLLVGCGKNPVGETSYKMAAGNIIGGIDVSAPNIYSKHTVGLYNEKFNTVCTGVIIEETLILTAAHCVYKTPAEKVKIVFGNKVLDKKANKVAAHRLTAHEKYDEETIANDVALIRLAKKIPDNYSFIDLEESRQLSLSKGDMVTAIGYGVSATGFFSANTRGTLRMGEVPIESYDNAANLVGIDQTRGVSICFGDSGGPTFTLVNEKIVLVGISSFVRSDKNGKKYMCSSKAYLSNPNFFYSWIQEEKSKI